MKFKIGDLVYVRPIEDCTEKEINCYPAYIPTMNKECGGKKVEVIDVYTSDCLYRLKDSDFWWSEHILVRSFAPGDKVTVKPRSQCEKEGILINDKTDNLTYRDDMEIDQVQTIAYEASPNIYSLSSNKHYYKGQWLVPYEEEELVPVNEPFYKPGDYVKLKSIAWYNKQERDPCDVGIYVKSSGSYDPFFILDKMKKYFGRTFKVIDYDPKDDYLYLEGVKYWVFNSETVEKIVSKAD